MGTVNVNGTIIQTNNGSITISNGRVIVDGKDVTPDSKVITISVEGNIEKLRVDSCEKVQVTGQCGTVSTTSGDIEIEGDVSGSVSSVSGDVDCRNVGGSISTVSGDVKHKKS